MPVLGPFVSIVGVSGHGAVFDAAVACDQLLAKCAQRAQEAGVHQPACYVGS